MIECWKCPHRRPAAYWWTAATSGNTIALCVECCAIWRQNASGIPSLAPSRIRLLALP